MGNMFQSSFMGGGVSSIMNYMLQQQMMQTMRANASTAADAEVAVAGTQADASKWSGYYQAQSNIEGYKAHLQQNRLSEAEQTRRHYNQMQYQRDRDIVAAEASLRTAQGYNETQRAIRGMDTNLAKYGIASNTLLRNREIDLKAGTLKWLQTGKYAGDAFFDPSITNDLRSQLGTLAASQGQPMTAGTASRIQQSMDQSQRTTSTTQIAGTTMHESQLNNVTLPPPSTGTGTGGTGTDTGTGTGTGTTTTTTTTPQTTTTTTPQTTTRSLIETPQTPVTTQTQETIDPVSVNLTPQNTQTKKQSKVTKPLNNQITV